MIDRTRTPTTIDEYIAGFPPPIQVILKKIRATIAAAAPAAQERISYRMPAFAQKGILLYFAAFKTHIGVYPPVSGDRGLEKALSAYTGPKGNLEVLAQSPHPIWPDWQNRDSQGEAEPGENAGGRAEMPRGSRRTA